MPKMQFNTNVANSIYINVANKVPPVWWMELYPLHFNQSK